MFVLQRVFYRRKTGTYVKVSTLGIQYGFGPAYGLDEATKFPSSIEANRALMQRTVSFPDFANEAFQLVEIAEVAVPPIYERVRVL